MRAIDKIKKAVSMSQSRREVELPDGSMFWPWKIGDTVLQRLTWEYAAGYLVVAVLIYFLGHWSSKDQRASGDDEDPHLMESSSAANS